MVRYRTFQLRPFELVSLADLRARLGEPTSGSGGLTFENISGDVRSLHKDPANDGAVFQVASQFNCLEMVGPGTTPDAGVTIYAKDATQARSSSSTAVDE